MTGYCVSPIGNIYRPDGVDPDAAQKAVDDVVAGASKAWLGAGTYNSVEVSTSDAVPGAVQGVGRDTYLDSGTSGPGLRIHNPNYGQIGTARIKVRDLAVTAGGSYPGFEADGAHEKFVDGVESQSLDGYAFRIVDTARSNSNGLCTKGAGDSALRLEYQGNNQCHNNNFGDCWFDYSIDLFQTNPPGEDSYSVAITGGFVGYNQATYGYITSNGA